MTWFADLTPYIYARKHSRNALNVGWLSKDHEFEHERADFYTILRLWKITAHPEDLCRGWHTCEFCTSEEWKLTDDRYANGTVFVPGLNGRIYAAPTMIHHYVKVHNYKPPKEFQEAVERIPL